MVGVVLPLCDSPEISLLSINSLIPMSKELSLKEACLECQGQDLISNSSLEVHIFGSFKSICMSMGFL